MKRRNIILTFAIIALLLIGVGYATLDDTLTIGGSAATEEAEFEVEFYSVLNVTEGNGSTASIESVDKHNLTLKVEGLKNKGDSVTFSVVVCNPSTEFAAVLESINLAFTDDTDENFSITSNFEDVADKEISALVLGGKTYDAALAEAEKFTFTITVTLNTVPNTEEGFSANISGSIYATAKAN